MCIDIGDEVRLNDGTLAWVKAFDRNSGLYAIGGHPIKILIYRHEFQPVKFDGDVVGVTGIGVCAKGANGQ